jgi:hypothetical protein
LLANDDRRPEGCDQAVHLGPEVPLVRGPGSLAGDGEWLAGAGASPEGSVVGPASKSSCMAPPAETREEVDLGKPSEIFGSDIYDAPLVNDAIGNVASGDQVTQPGGGVGVKLVVVGAHGLRQSISSLFPLPRLQAAHRTCRLSIDSSRCGNRDRGLM